jgi:hypothetical protein
MKLNKETLKRIIKEELSNLLNEQSNAEYRASRMMMGGGRPLEAILNPNKEENYVYDEEDDEYYSDGELRDIYNGVMNADHLAGRMHRGDMKEVERVGPRMKPNIEQTLQAIQQNPGRFTTQPAEEEAVIIFLQNLLSKI